MVDNIEKVLERGEKIELLVDKTDNLRFQVRPSGFSKNYDMVLPSLKS